MVEIGEKHRKRLPGIHGLVAASRLADGVAQIDVSLRRAIKIGVIRGGRSCARVLDGRR